MKNTQHFPSKLTVRAKAVAQALALTAVLGAASWAQAQSTYPAKPIRFIVGFTAGGSTDVIARILSRRLTETLGQPIVIENKPGLW